MILTQQQGTLPCAARSSVKGITVVALRPAKSTVLAYTHTFRTVGATAVGARALQANVLEAAAMFQIFQQLEQI